MPGCILSGKQGKPGIVGEIHSISGIGEKSGNLQKLKKVRENYI